MRSTAPGPGCVELESAADVHAERARRVQGREAPEEARRLDDLFVEPGDGGALREYVGAFVGPQGDGGDLQAGLCPEHREAAAHRVGSPEVAEVAPQPGAAQIGARLAGERAAPDAGHVTDRAGGGRHEAAQLVLQAAVDDPLRRDRLPLAEVVALEEDGVVALAHEGDRGARAPRRHRRR